MSIEAVTVTCAAHGRRCLLAEPLKGGGIRLRHEGPGAFGAASCDSQRFTVLHVLEQETTREGAHAELVRLDLMRQAISRSAPTGMPTGRSTVRLPSRPGAASPLGSTGTPTR